MPGNNVKKVIRGTLCCYDSLILNEKATLRACKDIKVQSSALCRQTSMTSYTKWGYQPSKSPKAQSCILLTLCIECSNTVTTFPLCQGATIAAANSSRTRHQNLLIDQSPLLVEPSVRRLVPPLQHYIIHLQTTCQSMVCRGHESILTFEVGDILDL